MINLDKRDFNMIIVQKGMFCTYDDIHRYYTSTAKRKVKRGFPRRITLKDVKRSTGRQQSEYLHQLYCHIDNSDLTACRSLYLDFSVTFNSIRLQSTQQKIQPIRFVFSSIINSSSSCRSVTLPSMWTAQGFISLVPT